MNRELEEMRGTITRRHALRIAIAGGMVLVSAGWIEEDAEAAPRWEAAGAVSQFQIGVPRRVKLSQGQVAYILRQTGDRWLALSARCTHEGAEIRWDPGQKRFVCPLHGATFSITGKNPTAPARNPLAGYPTRIKGKDVEIDAAKSPAVGGKTGGSKRHKEDEHEEDEKEHRGEKEKRREREDD